MKYLERTIQFMIKNYLLLVPLFILAALPALINGTGTANSLSNMNKMLSALQNPMSYLQDPTSMAGMFAATFAASTGAGFLAFLLRFAAIPSTYGMVNKAIETGKADLNEFVPALKQNFLKYIFYWLGNLAIWIIFGAAVFIVLLLLGLLALILKGVGSILLILAIIGFAIAAIIISVLISLWFSAMVIDNMDITGALKKSVEVAKTCFWTILGITLLVSIASGIAGFILSFLNFIPLIGPVVLSLIPAAASFLLIIFYLMIYRDKTGKT